MLENFRQMMIPQTNQISWFHSINKNLIRLKDKYKNKKILIK